MRRTVLMNAGPWLPVPPPGYGGIESLVAELIPRLRRRGTRVVLATVGASTIEADEKLFVFAEGQYARMSNRSYNTVSGIPHAHMLHVIRRLEQGDVDVVHDHLEVVGPSMLSTLGAGYPPALHTLHWSLERHDDFYRTFDGRGRVFFSAVSDSHLAQAGDNLGKQALGAVPTGIDPADFPFQRLKDDYFVVLGRITDVKGQDIAARICQRRGCRLVLAGPVASISSPEELAAALADRPEEVGSRPAVRYYLDRVQPHLDGERIRWIGTVDRMAKPRLLGRARALLMPVRWDEPFGLVAIEAMACGTPVLAMRRGNLPAMVEHGVNGFLAEDEDELESYLARAHEIDPAACRQTVERRFSAESMCSAYLGLYERVIATRPQTEVSARGARGR